jgi:Fic family protein
LITFLLCASGTLAQPILYLSLFFKQHRQTYYDLLTAVREEGDWEAWIEFFLTGVQETSEQAVGAARRILELLDSDRRKIEALGRSAASVLRVFHHTQTNPILSIPKVVEKVGISFPTATSVIEHLQELGIVREITGRQRSRLFVYDAYLGILNEGTEPLART